MDWNTHFRDLAILDLVCSRGALYNIGSNDLSACDVYLLAGGKREPYTLVVLVFLQHDSNNCLVFREHLSAHRPGLVAVVFTIPSSCKKEVATMPAYRFPRRYVVGKWRLVDGVRRLLEAGSHRNHRRKQ